MKSDQDNLIDAIPEMEMVAALEDWVLSLRAGNRSGRTIDDYEDKLGKFFWWIEQTYQLRRVGDVKPVHVRLFVQYLQGNPSRWGKPSKPLSEASVQDYYRVARAFFNWCEQDGIIAVSPWRSARIKTPKTMQKIVPAYSLDDIAAMLKACRHHDKKRSLRDIAVILLILDTGIRASELCCLSRNDMRQGWLRVLGKGNKERALPLSPPVEKAIRDYLRRRKDSASPLFLAATGKALTRFGLWQALKERAHQAGLDQSGVHRLRHSFALSFVKAGGPLHALQSLLGHSSSAMSLKYGQMISDDTGELHRQFSPVEQLTKRKKK